MTVRIDHEHLRPGMSNMIMVSITFILLFLLCPGEAFSRNCPSRLPSHQYEATDWLSMGLELRSFYFGADVGDGLPSSNIDRVDKAYQHNIMEGVRAGVSFFPLDDLTISLEGELRYRWPGWTGKRIKGLDLRLTQALIEYDADPIDLTGGVQILTFGSGAVLDQRFIALTGTYKTAWFNVTAFGGLTQRNMMKSAANCMWMRYMSDTNGWKFLSQRLFDNLVAGLTFSLKILRPHRIKLLYLFSRPSVYELGGHSLALSFSGPAVSRYLSYLVEPLALLDNGRRLIAGSVFEVRLRAGKGRHSLRFRVGAALAFNASKKHRMDYVYENLSWGMIRRFNLHGGNIFAFRTAWPLADWAKPFAKYYVQTWKYSSKSLQDELDLGVEFRLRELYSLVLAYTGMNLASPDLYASHGVYLEARVVFGE
ncbi:MAG: hypothetical protein GXP49_16900 [Deltaproteobacteria bacterium]|nr:hypothetical protein [Deltaproteobacteria bacterium]